MSGKKLYENDKTNTSVKFKFNSLRSFNRTMYDNRNSARIPMSNLIGEAYANNKNIRCGNICI